MGRKEKQVMVWLHSLFTAVLLHKVGTMVTAKMPENVKSSYLISNFTDISDAAQQ